MVFDAGEAEQSAVRQGEEVSDVDTGATFYTAENIYDPDIVPLLYD